MGKWGMSRFDIERWKEEGERCEKAVAVSRTSCPPLLSEMRIFCSPTNLDATGFPQSSPYQPNRQFLPPAVGLSSL